MSAPKKPSKKAVLLTTAGESGALRPFVESLALSAAAKNAVIAIGQRAALDSLQAALPSTLADADREALQDVVWTLGYASSQRDVIHYGFAVCTLSGSLDDARRAAKTHKLVTRSGADLDAAAWTTEEKAAIAMAAELADVDAARARLAKLPQAEREALLVDVVRSVRSAEARRRLAEICGKLDVGIEMPSRLMDQLPDDAELAGLAAIEPAIRKASHHDPEDPAYKHTVLGALFNPERHYTYLRRLVPLGGDFPERARVAAARWLGIEVPSLFEDVFRAAEDLPGDKEPVMQRIFQLWVWADECQVMLMQPNLPGHVDPSDDPRFLQQPGAFYECVCAECRAHRLAIGTRRIVALAPFDGLSEETKELVRKIVRIKRCKPIVPVLEEWAPSLKGAAGAAPSSAQKAKAKDAPPTPHLDAAEAWLAKVLATRTTATLKKLGVELEAFENADLMDEDGDRWQELDRSICDHRNTFPYGTKQHDILQEMSDFLTST